MILAEERGRLFVGDAHMETRARIVFRPNQFPSAQVELADLDVQQFDETPVNLLFVESGFTLDDGRLGAVEHAAVWHSTNFRHRVCQSEPLLLVRRGSVAEVDCFLYNLSRFGFEGGPSNGSEELDLDVPGWRVRIGPLPPAVRASKDLMNSLGTPWRRPTHSLRLVRTDAREVNMEETDEILFLVRYFLSFAWGRKVGIGLAQGFSANGQLVFARPGMTDMDHLVVPDARQSHWFPPSNAEILREILPGFWFRMTDPKWKDPIDWGLYFWLSANHAGQVAETSILASQAGLESIVDGMLGEYEKGPTQASKNPTAAEKIRRMLTVMHVPLGIPPTLAELCRHAALQKWEDGPAALTKVRNALVHPKKGNESGLAFEASHLGMWYLELGLLFLFGTGAGFSIGLFLRALGLSRRKYPGLSRTTITRIRSLPPPERSRRVDASLIAISRPIVAVSAFKRVRCTLRRPNQLVWTGSFWSTN